MAAALPAHLTLGDDEGYPLPIRPRAVELTDDGFTLDMPQDRPGVRAGAPPKPR